MLYSIKALANFVKDVGEIYFDGLSHNLPLKQSLSRITCIIYHLVERAKGHFSPLKVVNQAATSSRLAARISSTSS